MAGTIIADFIRTDANQLSLNVGNTTFATINAMGFLSNTGVQIISPTGAINAASIAAGSIPVGKLGAASVARTNMYSGAVLQVVQAFKSDTFSTTSTSFTDITGLSVSITPTSATSKILVKLVLSISGTNTSGSTYRITRGGSAIGIADAASSRNRGSGAELYNPRTDTNYNYGAEYLDSPSSTSSLTYAAQAIVGSGTGTIYVNRTSGDVDSGSYVRGVSSITVMEIAA